MWRKKSYKMLNDFTIFLARKQLNDISEKRCLCSVKTVSFFKMAPIVTSAYSIPTPPIGGCDVKQLNSPFAFVLVSMLLRTTLFLTQGGELRTSPLCSQEGRLHEDAEFISTCAEAGRDIKVCYFMKKTSYLLAMQETDGQLTSIKLRVNQTFNPQSTELCTLFRVQTHHDRGHPRNTITGCLDRKHPWHLAMDGQRFKPECSGAHCDCTKMPSPYYQVSSREHTLTTFERSFFLLDNTFINANICPNNRHEKMIKACPGVLRTSYPVNWSKCT